jgi:hypothetical protein
LADSWPNNFCDIVKATLRILSHNFLRVVMRFYLVETADETFSLIKILRRRVDAQVDLVYLNSLLLPSLLHLDRRFKDRFLEVDEACLGLFFLIMDGLVALLCYQIEVCGVTLVLVHERLYPQRVNLGHHH